MVIIVTAVCIIIKVLWARKLIGANDLKTKIFHFDIIKDRVPYLFSYSHPQLLLVLYSSFSFFMIYRLWYNITRLKSS